MPSLADIPDNLLSSDLTEQFIDWLTTLPLEYNHLRELANIWRQSTRSTLTADQWKRIELSAEPNPDG